MTREAGSRLEGGDSARESSDRGGEQAASLSREVTAGFETTAKRGNEPASGSLNFDKPIYPNQQFAGLSSGTMTDASGPYKTGDPKGKGDAPDTVVGKSSIQNEGGGYTDTSIHSGGSVETTTYNKDNQAIKNRTQNPDGSFNQSTLDKNNNVTVREQQSDGDFTETTIGNDGKVTSKARVTNQDYSVTDSVTGANGVTDSTTSKNGKLIAKKSENADGSYTERKLNADNSVTFHDQKADGSYVETRNDKDGSAKTIHQVDGAGGSTTKSYDAQGNLVKDRTTEADRGFVETTKNKDGTETKHDQRPNGDFSEATFNENHELVGPVFDAKGTATPEFVNKVREQIAKLPEGVKQTLAQDRAHILATGMMEDASPELAGKQPRGHKEGTTWNDLDGGQIPDTKRIIVAERSNDGLTKPDRAEGVFNHETGHGLDQALGYASNSPEFIAAYNKDVAAMTPEQKNREKYELQDGAAGRSETFAEVFASVNGSSCIPDQTANRITDYPNVTEYMKKKLKELPQ